MSTPPQPPPPTASSLHARTRVITSPELALVSNTPDPMIRLVTTAERQRLDAGVGSVTLPDDGEPNPAEPGRRAPDAAPCGRPEPCDVGDCATCRARGGRGHPEYLALTDELKKLHLVKSGGYGTGRDPFANFTNVSQASGEPRYLYPILRSLEKLTRCLSLHTQGRTDELEEEFKDVASLLLCAAAMRREDTRGTV